MKNRAFDHSKYKDWISPDEVVPYEMNAKVHNDRQIKNIVNSIRRFGWQQDVVITSDNVLVIGHGRRLAALQIGCEMPYHRIDKAADELTDKDIRELRIADNQTNAETGFDWAKLELEIGDLDFSGFDFDFADPFDGENGGGQTENYSPSAEAPQEWKPLQSDDGYKEAQEPLSKEELDMYRENADDMLFKRRIIITYLPEQEMAVKALLNIGEEKELKVVYDFSEIA